MLGVFANDCRLIAQIGGSAALVGRRPFSLEQDELFVAHSAGATKDSRDRRVDPSTTPKRTR
jgi:hypothetical protein